MIGELALTTQRHRLLWWYWRLEFRHNGVRTLIADGYELRKRKAQFAAQSWQRVWLRDRGMLNT